MNITCLGLLVCVFAVPAMAQVTCLTPKGGQSPAFFPDGKRLTYVEETPDGEQHLKILDLATGKSTRVGTIDGAERPAVSPDGKWIAYASGPVFARQIRIVNPTNPEPRQISLPSGMPSFPAWTDGGKKLFLTLSLEKQDKWIKIDPFKKGDPIEDIKPFAKGQIVFSHSGKLAAVVTADEKGTTTLRIVRSDGSLLVAIPPVSSSTPTTPVRGCYDPAFSPDDRYLAYVRSDIQPAADLYLRDLKTGAETPLTTDRSDNQSPAFSPDGRSIVFVAAKSGQSHRIWLLRLSPVPTTRTR